MRATPAAAIVACPRVTWPSRGGMAEWFKAAVLKTAERQLRGFESYSLRQHSLGEVAEWLKAAAC